MKRPYYILLILITLISCKTDKKESHQNTVAIPSNMSEENMAGFNWMNDPKSYEIIDNSMVVSVTKGTDFFNNPEDNSNTSTAPFLHKSITGNFVAKTLVRPDFSSQWNAVALMVYVDELNWIKFAFENSDATGPSIVTVVTKETSDDANGVVLNNTNQIWLAIAKKDSIYAMHWSKDGENYKMARLTKMGEANEVKVGIEFQSPVGDKATHTAHYFEAEMRTVENLRLLK